MLCEYLVVGTEAWSVEMCEQEENEFSAQNFCSGSACCYCLQDSRTTGSETHQHITASFSINTVKYDMQGVLDCVQSAWCVTLTCRPCELTAAGLASECRGDAPVRPPAVISPMRPGGGAPRGGIWKGLWPRLPKPALTDPAVGRELDPYAGHLRKNTREFICEDEGNAAGRHERTVSTRTLSGTRRCPSWFSAGRGGATSAPAVSTITAASSASL